MIAEWSLTMSSAVPCLNGSNSSRDGDLTNRASDRLQKPAESSGANQEALDLREEALSASMFEETVGSSEAISQVTRQVIRVAPSTATVLITGESGTGKELI